MSLPLLDDPRLDRDGDETAAAKRRRWLPSGGFALTAASLIIAGLLSFPILAVAASVFMTGEGNWGHLARTVLPDYILNTLILSGLVGTGVTVIGVGTAWLVTMCRFWTRPFFEWLLILPMAAPAYVIAYAYTDFLQHSGPVQTMLRDVMGWGPQEYWFPNIRSIEGAALMFTLVLYPYVYLLSRQAFLSQSMCALEAARSLGASPWGAFWRVALPMARPAIAAGAALALMETLADFGTVAHFGVQTFTTGIYKTWFSMGDRVLAAQLSTVLLAFVILIILSERWSRRGQRFDDSRANFRALPAYELNAWQTALSILACAAPVILGFILPAGILLEMAIRDGHDLFGARYVQLTLNSFTLAGTTALVAVGLALIMLYGVRLRPGRLARFSIRLASLGYAVPGSVIAVGVFIPLAGFDNSLDAFMRETFGISTGLLLTGSIAGLIFAYLVRFMTVSLNTVDASLARVTPNMDAAARTLGAGPGRTLVRVHAPIVRGGLITAGLIVFVDVMKELPATLMMRPFNFDTLAIQAYRLASDERLTEASTASLVILGVGLLPVVLLSRTIMRSRPGSGGK